jgi:hypothetical protein
MCSVVTFRCSVIVFRSSVVFGDGKTHQVRVMVLNTIFNNISVTCIWLQWATRTNNDLTLPIWLSVVIIYNILYWIYNYLFNVYYSYIGIMKEINILKTQYSDEYSNIDIFWWNHDHCNPQYKILKNTTWWWIF